MIIKRTIEEDLKQFENFLYEEEKSENTIKKYVHDVNVFLQFAEEREITKAVIMLYKQKLSETYAVASANSMIAAMNAFLKFMGWDALCVKQFKVQKKTYCSEEKELTCGEYQRLIKAAEHKKNERLSLVIQTMCGTGIRVGELSYITVEAVKRGEAEVCGKGKIRKIFIVRNLCKKLKRYAKACGIFKGPIFVTKNGKPLDRSNIWNDMKKLCKDAEVSKEKVFPHNLRHLFARTFYRLEKDIAKLADILGHSSINTTRIYMITTGAEHKCRMERMRLVT